MCLYVSVVKIIVYNLFFSRLSWKAEGVFSKGTFLYEANLIGANLRDANLSSARLRKADTTPRSVRRPVLVRRPILRDARCAGSSG